MPRSSKRQKYIKQLQNTLQRRFLFRGYRTINDEEDSLEDIKDVVAAVATANAKQRRYLFRHPKYRIGCRLFERDLNHPDHFVDTDGNESNHVNEEDSSNEYEQLPWLTEDEFLQKYRTTRKSFNLILDEIKDHPVFGKKYHQKKKQAPVAHQLMVFLKFIGSEGAGSNKSNQRQTFSIGYGTALLYKKRITRAILSLRDKYYYWPTEEERQQIALAIHEEYHFPHCVGIADGTLFELAFEPQTKDAPDYSGRKYGYSITTMIICDHKRRICHYLSGYPGSAHDNRVWKNTLLHTRPTEYFDPMQYCIGDSAFQNDWMMVSAYKKAPNCTLQDDHEFFNSKLAKLRIISEHCIGILKGRFPWLRSIRLVLTEDKASLRRILQLIDATIIIHNMLIDFGEEDIDSWIDYDDFSDIAMQTPYEKDDELNKAVPAWKPKDTRRTQLLLYFKEYFSLH